MPCWAPPRPRRLINLNSGGEAEFQVSLGTEGRCGCGCGGGGVRGFFTGGPRHIASMLLSRRHSATHGESQNACVESIAGVNWSSIVPRL